MAKYRTYKNHKPSGEPWFPHIPQEWDVIRARRAFKQVRESSKPGDEQLAATQKYGVIPQSLYMEQEDQKVVLALSGTENFRRVAINDFVISLRSFQGGIERCHYQGCVSPAYTVMRIQKDLHPLYLGYLLKSEGFISALQSVTQGIREGKTITFDQFGGMGLPMPSFDEQETIAAFLDHETAKIDRLIDKQERLIELLKEKRQAVISHAVTKGLDPKAPMKDSGVEWLGEVPAHWKVAKVAYHYEVVLGKMLDEKRITGEHLAPYLRNTDVQWDCINTDDLPEMDFTPDDRKKYQLRTGDLLVCEGGEVGRAALWSGALSECYYQKALHRLRPIQTNNDLPRFMLYLLWHASTQGRFTGSSEGKATIAHLPAEKLRQYRFPFPPMREQCTIVEFLDEQNSKMDQLMDKARGVVLLLQEHRTALIAAAVTGQIDLRGWRAPDQQSAAQAATV